MLKTLKLSQRHGITKNYPQNGPKKKKNMWLSAKIAMFDVLQQQKSMKSQPKKKEKTNDPSYLSASML
jgi:hypothetical protein